MGLEVHVGILSELHELGEEQGLSHYLDQFGKINTFLADKKFPAHKEPESLGDEKPWAASMGGYNDLHELRRVAVHLLGGKGLPPPSTGRATKDPLLDSYFKEHRYRIPTPPEMMGRSHPTPWGFKHLLLHSDSEGFYLPLNFKFVLIPPPETGIAGGMIGSCVKLAEELVALRNALQVPAHLSYDSTEIEDAVEEGGVSDHPEPWRRLAVATHSLLVLIHALRISNKTRCAIVFG